MQRLKSEFFVRREDADPVADLGRLREEGDTAIGAAIVYESMRCEIMLCNCRLCGWTPDRPLSRLDGRQYKLSTDRD